MDVFFLKHGVVSYTSATALTISRHETNDTVRVDATNNKKQHTQLSQRDRAAGCVSFGQKWKTGTGRQYFTDIIGLSSTTVI